MAKNAAGFSESIVMAGASPQAAYSYRTGIGMVPSTEWSVFFDDFYQFIVSTSITNGPPANAPITWSNAIIDTGATATVLTTATVGANGVLALADATASEGVAICGTKSIQLIPGKKFMMEMRVRTNDVTDNAIQFGLSDLTAVVNPEDLWTTTSDNVLAAGILDGSALVGVLADEANAGTAAVAGTRSMVVDTWHILGLLYDGIAASVYVDGKLSVTTAVTVPEAVALAPFFGHINGNGAGGATVFVDYVRWSSER